MTQRIQTTRHTCSIRVTTSSPIRVQKERKKQAENTGGQIDQHIFHYTHIWRVKFTTSTQNMNIRHEKKRQTQNRWKKKTNNDDIQELQRNSKIIKDKIKTGFKNESSLADIEKSLNSLIDVSIVLARHLETKNTIKSLLGAIRILLNKPEADVMQDDLLD